jgi:hypothetical protein
MRHVTKERVLVCAIVAMMGLPCLAQDVEPPFTWEGKGTASLIEEGGINDIDFKFELSVDEMGMFKGQTSSDDGTARIVHVFSSEKKEYSLGGLFSRNIVIVQIFNEYGDNPMLSILNARVLNDRFIYGELLLTSYESGSSKARTLGVGNSEVTLMEGDELPWNLKSTLGDCIPVGVVKIEGNYKD